jgi:probable rRNA maturation factor
MKNSKLKEKIAFFSPDLKFKIQAKNKTRRWISEIICAKKYKIANINYIFVDDEELYRMNLEVLAHDYYTDIMTFPFHKPSSKRLETDIYISIDRVKENANTNETSFYTELHRVMAHGVLHLLGFDDHSEAEILVMRQAEEKSLQKRPRKLKDL